MKKLEAIIRPEQLQPVQDALDELGVSGLTVTEVMGCGRQKGYTESYRGSRVNISLLPKLKVESVVPNEVVDKTVDAIIAAAYTGETGDGRVFVSDIEQAVRIRTGERGEDTVRHEAPVGWGTEGRGSRRPPAACMRGSSAARAGAPAPSRAPAATSADTWSTPATCASPTR